MLPYGLSESTSGGLMRHDRWFKARLNCKGTLVCSVEPSAQTE